MKSINNYFEQERGREPIIDAAGVERFVEGVVNGRDSGEASRRVRPIPAAILGVAILTLTTLMVVGSEADNEVGAAAPQAPSQTLASAYEGRMMGSADTTRQSVPVPSAIPTNPGSPHS